MKKFSDVIVIGSIVVALPFVMFAMGVACGVKVVLSPAPEGEGEKL